MSKTVVIGDIHDRSIWKKIVEKENPDRVIFIGDYFDNYENTPAVEQIFNFEEIVRLKEAKKAQVIILIGNHDYHYFPEIGDRKISGYQRGARALSISGSINEHRDSLQMAYRLGNIIFTHAGISETFLNDNGWKPRKSIVNFVNELWRHKPLAFDFNGWDPYGNNITQTPIWIRPGSLIEDTKNISKNLIQVVGHTEMREIDLKSKFVKDKYVFIDVLGTSKEYLIIENQQIKKGNVK